jgi:hypothetical protein
LGYLDTPPNTLNFERMLGTLGPCIVSLPPHGAILGTDTEAGTFEGGVGGELVASIDMRGDALQRAR